MQTDPLEVIVEEGVPFESTSRFGGRRLFNHVEHQGSRFPGLVHSYTSQKIPRDKHVDIASVSRREVSKKKHLLDTTYEIDVPQKNPIKSIASKPRIEYSSKASDHAGLDVYFATWDNTHKHFISQQAITQSQKQSKIPLAYCAIGTTTDSNLIGAIQQTLAAQKERQVLFRIVDGPADIKWDFNVNGDVFGTLYRPMQLEHDAQDNEQYLNTILSGNKVSKSYADNLTRREKILLSLAAGGHALNSGEREQKNAIVALQRMLEGQYKAKDITNIPSELIDYKKIIPNIKEYDAVVQTVGAGARNVAMQRAMRKGAAHICLIPNSGHTLSKDLEGDALEYPDKLANGGFWNTDLQKLSQSKMQPWYVTDTSVDTALGVARRIGVTEFSDTGYLGLCMLSKTNLGAFKRKNPKAQSMLIEVTGTTYDAGARKAA